MSHECPHDRRSHNGCDPSDKARLRYRTREQNRGGSNEHQMQPLSHAALSEET